MHVLDCGCGPGSLTVDLAAHVTPGNVIGIDIEAVSLSRARDLARSSGISNVRFEQADVYALPYPSGHFDAVFSHGLTSHLRDVPRALAEMRRVLKPGGFAAVADNDGGAHVVSPAGSAMDRFLDLLLRVQRHNGGDSLRSRHLRGAMLEAGFVRVEMDVRGELASIGTDELNRTVAIGWGSIARSVDFVQTVLTQGWATQAELDALPSEMSAWAERPDAFLNAMKCGALGWAPNA
jgi:SAM-dependent methyltransferase